MARTGEQLNPGEVITVEELDAVTNNSMIYKDNAGSYQAVAIGASGTVPTSNGATSAPTFETPGGGGTATAVVISAKVNEVAGINVGQVVFISGATGGFPQVSLADNTMFAEASVLAMAVETKTDGQTISVITSGLLEGFDTSTFLEGDILYLGTAGNITKTHPSGINAVQRLGNAVKINASTGSMVVTLDPLTIINDHDGIMRHQIVNQNTGTSASAAYTVVNDALHRASLSMVGSNYNVVAGITNSMIIYNEGYNKTVNAVDGNFGFEWWTDETDSHNLSSTSKMELAADGQLKTIQQCIDHTATTTDDHAVEIIANAAGFGDVKAFDIDYITGAIGLGDDEAISLINIDETLSSGGGEVAAYEVLTTAEGSANIVGLKTGINVGPISQFSGVFVNAATILNIAVDVTTALSSGGAGNITAFAADNDTFTIGSSAKFEEIEVILDTGASQNTNPTFEFSTGVGTWGAFTPTDGTNGFRNTGEVLWNDADIPSWAVGTGSEYLIRITRTRNNLNTDPIIDLIQISAVTVYSWDKDGDVVIRNLDASGTIKTNTLDTVSGTDTTVNQNLIVSGDLTVNGTTTTINSATLEVEDKNIEMGAVTTPTDTTADGGGITLLGTTNKTIIWDNANDNWTFNQAVNIATGLDYKVNNVSVLNATTLGSAVVGSSLTSTGALNSGSITSGFGAIDNGASTITTTGLLKSGTAIIGNATDGVSIDLTGAVTEFSLGGVTSGARGLFEYNRSTGLLSYKEGTFGAEGSSLLEIDNAGNFDMKAGTITTTEAISGQIKPTLGTFEGGIAKLYTAADFGLITSLPIGTTFDYLLANSAGTSVMHVPTGTLDTVFGGAITTIGTITGGLVKAITAEDSIGLQIDTPYGISAEKYASIRFNNTTFAGGHSEIRNLVDGSSSTGSELALYTTQTGGSVLTERMRIGNNGNVGIGLTPTANMDGLSIEAGLLTLKETTTPTADTNYGKVYTKTDNELYFQDGAGVEKQVSNQGGGGGVSGIFEATPSGTLALTTTIATVQFNTENVDTGGDYNTGTYTYTAPSTGNYMVYFDIAMFGLTDQDKVRVEIAVGGTTVLSAEADCSGDTAHLSASKVLALTASDAVIIRARNTTASRGTVNAGTSCSFGGYKLA